MAPRPIGVVTWVRLLWLAVVGAQKIAIIGGGTSGSFALKYLTDYDPKCVIDSMTVFEPYPVDQLHSTTTRDTDDSPNDHWQGSRVSAIRLKDGTVVEVGASVMYKGFHHVIDMIRNDPSLVLAPPFDTGLNQTDSGLRKGMGIYNGNGRWPLLMTTSSGYLASLTLLWRYHWDLIKVTRLCRNMQEAFAMIPTLLASDREDTFFESPDAIWHRIGLYSAVHSSFDRVLDVLGIRHGVAWWQKLFLPFQGSLRDELLQAVNLVNYNQDTAHVNGVVGMGSFAASSGGLFSLAGGNYQIIRSAMQQAQNASTRHCGRAGQLQQSREIVTTIVGDAQGLDLFTGEGQQLLGRFDVVLLAAPIQHSRIQFLVRSFHDPSVLQPMPLAGLIDPEIVSTEDGHPMLPGDLPDSATRPYTQVVTTVVSNASLSSRHLFLTEQQLPATILTTSQGKAALYNITAIRQIKSDVQLYKVFSDDRLDEAALVHLFGPHHQVEYVKLWGGLHGGATPDYQGQGASAKFLIYDGAAGMEGHTYAGALYYPSTMEQSSLACIELCAVGAKAVAKLVAKRLGLVKPVKSDSVREEL